MSPVEPTDSCRTGRPVSSIATGPFCKQRSNSKPVWSSRRLKRALWPSHRRRIGLNVLRIGVAGESRQAGNVFLNLIRPTKGALIRAAASTQPLGVKLGGPYDTSRDFRHLTIFYREPRAVIACVLPRPAWIRDHLPGACS